MPKVSVVIPCYNSGKYLGDTIHSILAQDYTDYEIIVVNDGSTDHFTLDKLEIYTQHPRISILTQANKGGATARNTGIAHAQSPWILIIDADDYIAPHFISLGADILSAQDKVGVVTSYARQINAWLPPIYPSGGDFVHALFDNVSLSMSMFRKKCWTDTAGFDENMRLGDEDWDFWIRVCKHWKIHVIPQYLFYYRITRGSVYQSFTVHHMPSIRKYIYTKYQEAYAQHFVSLVWVAVKVLRKSPYLIPDPPYQFVLACKDNLSYTYPLFKFCYKYILLPIYSVSRYIRNQLFGEPLETRF